MRKRIKILLLFAIIVGLFRVSSYNSKAQSTKACSYNPAFGTCGPASTCPAGQTPAYNCSQHNGNESACNNVGTPFSCTATSSICQWAGASSCEPYNVCSAPEIISSAYASLCHSAGTSAECLAIGASAFSAPKCMSPDGWYCLPNSGISSNCAPCFNSPPSGYTSCGSVTRIDYAQCSNCNFTSPPPASAGASPLCGSGIRSAIGCIPVLNDAKGTAFSSYILRWAVGIGGGIAFILIIYASFMVMTSQGNPERLKAGQELLTSAISGLLLLVFSIFLLNLIGVKILGIFQ